MPLGTVDPVLADAFRIPFEHEIVEVSPIQ
jgi:hypothetical protein